jgi:hypothetical protein
MSGIIFELVISVADKTAINTAKQQESDEGRYKWLLNFRTVVLAFAYTE